MADNSVGILNGTSIGSMMGRDTTNIDPKLLAIMKMRRLMSKDNTPVYNGKEALEEINRGERGLSKQQRDSIASKFDHEAYLRHLDSIGMQVVPKKQ